MQKLIIIIRKTNKKNQSQKIIFANFWKQRGFGEENLRFRVISAGFIFTASIELALVPMDFKIVAVLEADYCSLLCEEIRSKLSECKSEWRRNK